MAQRSDEIEAEIEATREHMGATVDALAYKADVPSRTKEWLGEKKEAVVSKVSDVTPLELRTASREHREDLLVAASEGNEQAPPLR